MTVLPAAQRMLMDSCSQIEQCSCDAQLGKEKKRRRRVSDISAPRSSAASCIAQKSLVTSGAHAENLSLLSVLICFEACPGKWQQPGATLAASRAAQHCHRVAQHMVKVTSARTAPGYDPAVASWLHPLLCKGLQTSAQPWMDVCYP